MLAAAPGAGRPVPLRTEEPPGLSRDPSILLIRPDHLGDVLFTGPAVDVLRGAFPGGRITMVVGPWALPAACRLPGIDHVSTVAFPWFDRAPGAAPWRSYTRLAGAARRLRRLPHAPFDCAVILRDDDYWGAWLAALAGVGVRAGHDLPGVRTFLTHALPEAEAPLHVAARAVALAAGLAGEACEASPDTHPLRFQVTDEDRSRAQHVLDGALAGVRPGGSDAGGFVAVHPGSGAAVKRWRPGAWRDTLGAVAGPRDVLIVTGSAAERPLADDLAEALTGRRVANLAGLTDLGALAAVYERCRLVMGPDSGPLHLAVAVGVPTVHLYGPADAARFGPWGPAARQAVVAARLPCAPCGRLDWPDVEDHPCVRAIAVDTVRAAAMTVSRCGPGPCGTPPPLL